MFRINRYLEEHNLKTFALLPLRHGFIPRNIRLTSRDFKKLLEHGAGIEAEKQQKREEVVSLTDNDVFIAFKFNKVISLYCCCCTWLMLF
jgi:hypothetical protein